MTNFIQICKERGYFHQCTDEAGLGEALKAAPAVAYIGFDCTAKSLHVGSLLQIMMLRHWQKSGHKPIVLMGGGTTKVGDPSGKDEARKLLTEADIQANMDSIKQVFAKYLTFETNFNPATNHAYMVNNAEWLDQLNYIEFLRDYGRHFSVNRMLTMDSVKLRLERDQPLSFLEFNYMILQAYDFAELSKRYNCRLQMGGSDQWGNIVNGTELSRRVGRPECFGLTSPLITTSSGAKMGKTAQGAVWLNADMLSPYDYWQFWRNTEDADVVRFLKFFTDLSMEEITKLGELKDAQINDAKKILATEATALLHGRAAAEEAAETARRTFEEGTAGENLPEINVPQAELAAGVPAFKLFHMAGLAASGGEARRLIKGKGAKVNDVVVEAEDKPISSADITAEGYIKLSAGKKRHALVRAA